MMSMSDLKKNSKVNKEFLLTLFKLTNSELLKRVSDNKALQEELKKKTAEKMTKQSELIKKKWKSQQHLMKIKIELEEVKKRKESWDEEVKIANEKYNTLVEPFNKLKIEFTKCREVGHKIGKKFNEKFKAFDEEKLRKKHEISKQKKNLDAAREKLAAKNKSLKVKEEILAQKLAQLDEDRLDRQHLKNYLDQVDVNLLKEEIDEAIVDFQHDEDDFHYLQNQNDLADETIKEIAYRKADYLELFSEMKEKLIETLTHKAIFQNRFQNELKLTEQIVKNKGDRLFKRQEGANMKLAMILRDQLNDIKEGDKQINDFLNNQSQLDEHLNYLEMIKIEKLNEKQEYENYNANVAVQNENMALEVNALISSIKEKSDEIQEIFKDIERIEMRMSNKIESEIRQQKLVELDDDSSDDSMSIISDVSSSFKEDMDMMPEAEKIDFDLSKVGSSASKRPLRKKK